MLHRCIAWPIIASVLLLCCGSSLPALGADPEQPPHDAAAASLEPNDQEQTDSSHETASSHTDETEHNAHAGGSEAEGDHGHHDPYDLSHADAGPGLESPTEWRYDMALASFLVFCVLLLILSFVAWGPIMSGLQQREQAIASRIEDAERAAAAAQEQLRAYEEKMAAAADEAQAIIAQGRRDAEAVADKVRAQAQEDALKQRQRALADIETAKNAALRDLAAQSTEIAVHLAGQIVRRELQPDDHAALITESLSKFSNQN